MLTPAQAKAVLALRLQKMGLRPTVAEQKAKEAVILDGAGLNTVSILFQSFLG